MTRVLVDGRWRSGGIKRFADELLSRIGSQFEIEFTLGTSKVSSPFGPISLAAEIRKTDPDVFWSPGFIPPATSSVPFVFSIHDLIHVRASGKLKALYYQCVILPLARKAFKIVTVSEFSRQDICTWSGVAEDRVVVIPNAVSQAFGPLGETYAPGFPYVFYVGARKQHKNLPALLTAFAQSRLLGQCKLLLSGAPDPELQQFAAQLTKEDFLHFAGFIPDESLPEFYRGALAVAMVSTFEGFGLPVLEGMACGVPVVCSNSTSLGEIGEGAARLVDPYRTDEIADALERVVFDPGLRQTMINAGLQRASEFSWQRSAGILGEVLSSAANSK